jgi:ubiquitin-like 1-activating enzyme E1 A
LCCSRWQGFSAAVLDDGACAAEDLGANFLLRETSVGQNRATAAVPHLQELNPMVTVTAMPRPTSDITPALLREGRFNVVLLSGPCKIAEVARVNAACREAGAAFFFVDMYGFLGFGFSDLGADFAYRAGSADAGDEQLVSVPCCTLGEALNTPWATLQARRFGTSPIYFVWHCLALFRDAHGGTLAEATPEAVHAFAAETCRARGVDASTVDAALLDTMLRCASMDVSPACAVIGGMLGQEIVKSIARKSKPLHNTFMLDALAQATPKGGLLCVLTPPSLSTKP